MKPSWGKVRIGVLATLSAAAFAVISAATLTVSHAQLAASPWPMYHHDLRHTGLSTVDTSADTGTLMWKFATGAGVQSSPALGADGTIYIGSEDNNLYALNPNGTLKWKFATGDRVENGCDAVESSPAVGADGTIYVGSLDHYVYAFGSPPPPVNCKSLVQSIENMRHHGAPGPRFTAAQWAQIQKELQQCVAEGEITRQQANAAMAGGNSYSNNLPNSGPPLRGTPMQ